MGQGTGERGRKYMKKRKKVKYTDEKIGKVKIVSDFLPRPEDLVLKEEAVKVTLMLSKASVDFFKRLAEKEHTHYQKMIRMLLEKYTDHFGQ